MEATPQRSRHRWLPSAYIVAACSFGCGAEEATEAPPPPPPSAESPAEAPAASAEPEAEAEAEAEAPSPGDSNFGTIELSPGFSEDPHTTNGTSGGETLASTLDPSCTGHISTTPDHLFVAQAAFADLRIMANSSQDVTLVVQRPDGSYLCNDDWADGEGATHPLVSGAFAPGTYKIWVGSYEGTQPGRYTLGISELNTVTPASLN